MLLKIEWTKLTYMTCSMIDFNDVKELDYPLFKGLFD